MATEATSRTPTEWLELVEGNLSNVVSFWLEHSIDSKFGGYFNNLDRDGSVYDTKKHVWLQGRQVWMLSHLYNEREAYRTPQMLEACHGGAAFLKKYAMTSEGRVYFCLSQDGKPVALQRKIFAECFFVMAMSEYAKVLRLIGKLSEAEETFQLACKVFKDVHRFSQDLSLVGAVAFSGQPDTHPLNMPMIMLNVICELRTYNNDASFYSDIAAECVPLIKMHVHEDRKCVLETVAPDGSFIDTPDGRLLNPGHAIEAGWFLLDYATRYPDEGQQDLIELGLKMIDWSLETGWDETHGGIFYFLDAEAHSPEQLEWPMKLWWVHCEAMVGTLMAFKVTKDPVWWEKFEKVAKWTMSHFPDTEANAISVEMPQAKLGIAKDMPAATMRKAGGEWFGYLNRNGTVSQRFKGGPYKGCFHVPRAMDLCVELLKAITTSA
eukprot:m.330893 g.330893  ORF g.330893 m.330893 type:complete len:436 (-) comp16050_c2_seq2:121-1428(-)